MSEVQCCSFNQPPSSTFSQTWGWSFVSQFDPYGWSFNGFTVNKLKINTRVFGMLSVLMVPVALNDSVKIQSAACFLWGEKCTEKNHYCSSVITGFLRDVVPQEKACKTQRSKMKGMALWQVTPKSTVCLDKTQRTHGTNHRWSKIWNENMLAQANSI